MPEQYLTIWDVVISAFYILILLLIARYIRDKFYPRGNPLRKYYIPGLLVKFLGVIFIACIYQFYYGSGDTFNYYKFGKLVNSSLSESFDTWLNLILRVSPETDPYLYPYASSIEFYNDPSTYMVVRLSALFGLLNFNSYVPIALLFAFISYSGIWAMYRTFVAAYPTLHKELAIAFLFVPSVFVWGSSIFKDTVCMFGLGWMTYTSFRIFINKDLRVRNFLLLAISFYLVGVIKVYILLAFLPSIALWLMLTHSSRVKQPVIRFFFFTLIASVIIAGFVFLSNRFSNQLNRYSLDKITHTLDETRYWITYSSGEEGSTYDLGEFEPTILGFISKFPSAVTVTLFRPFLWEVKKPIMLLSALEGLLFIIFVIIAFVRNGILKTFRLIFQSPNLSFFFVYSLIFAFAVGISTGNFGALSRYKIPCMPFFAAFLVILLFNHKIKKGQMALQENEK